MDVWYEGGWFKQTPRTRFQADYVSIAQSSSVWLYRATQPLYRHHLHYPAQSECLTSTSTLLWILIFLMTSNEHSSYSRAKIMYPTGMAGINLGPGSYSLFAFNSGNLVSPWKSKAIVPPQKQGVHLFLFLPSYLK